MSLRHNSRVMKPRINLKKIWFDDDVTELRVEVNDGTSFFCNKVYIWYGHLDELIKDISVFRERIHGGLFDIKLGEFGPEFANGGFHARLNFHKPGKLIISTHQQSDFEEFSKNKVASEAKMYLRTEPILLDNFIQGLKRLNSGDTDEATFECI